MTNLREGTTSDADRISISVAPLYISIVAFALFTSGVWLARRDIFFDGSMLYVARFVQLVVCFMVAYLARKHLPSVTVLTRFAAAVFVLHLALYLTSFFGSSRFPALGLTSTIFDGIGNASVTLLLAHLFSTYAPRRSARAIAAAFLLTEIVFAAGALLPSEAVHVMQPVFKALGFGLFLIALKLKTKTVATVDEHPMQYGLLPDGLAPDKPMKFLMNSADWTFQFIIATVFPFLFGFMSQLLSTGGLSAGLHDVNNEVIAVSAMLLLALYAMQSSAGFGFRGMLLVVVLLYATGFLLFPVLYQQQSAYSGTLIKLAMTIYQAVLWIMLARKAFEDPRHTYLYFGVFIGWANVSYGRLIEPILVSNAALGSAEISYVSIGSLWVLTILCLMLFTLQSTRFVSDYSPGGEAAGAETTRSGSPQDMFARNLETFADVNRLTKREREVLVEAVHGYSMENIGKNLFCSPETVRTHMKNIYAKTGARNKQALIKQIDEFKPTSQR